MTRALLITNPFAARADARAVTAILKILGRGGWNVDLQTITGPGDARHCWSSARPAQGTPPSHRPRRRGAVRWAALLRRGRRHGIRRAADGRHGAAGEAPLEARRVPRPRRHDVEHGPQRTPSCDRRRHRARGPGRDAAGAELRAAAAWIPHA